jgi:hypothetical protein
MSEPTCILCKQPTDGKEFFGKPAYDPPKYFHGKCLIRRIETRGLASTPVIKPEREPNGGGPFCEQ